MKLPKIPYGYLLLGPSIAFAVGFLSNAIVMAVNGGAMPVLYSGGCQIFNEQYGDDLLHSCMTHATHLKFLADWIVIRGAGIFSPGDFLEMFWDVASVPSLVAWVISIIHEANRK